MPWLKLDDALLDHRKVRRAIRDGGLGALGLHVAGLLNAAKYLTDGHVEDEFVEEIFDLARVRSDDARGRLVNVLVKRELWLPDDRGGFSIHDYLDHNPSREQVEANREWDKRRQQLSRDPELVAAIKKRDRNRCRYCTVKVDWKDRRSSAGATYDHVDPDGPNTLENVVVACRGCNSRKGGRTPEAAGMTLLPEPPAFKPRSSDDLETVGDGSSPRPDPAHSHTHSSPQPPQGGGELLPGLSELSKRASKARDGSRRKTDLKALQEETDALTDAADRAPAEVLEQWAAIDAQVRESVGDDTHARWLSPLRPIGRNADGWLIGCPEALRAWVADRLGDVLEAYAGEPVRLVAINPDRRRAA